MKSKYQKSRPRNLYDPKSKSPYRISRSKIENYLRCERCFYLDRRLGVSQPPSFPFNLNSAVDALLKTEFDLYRDKGEPHPIMEESGIAAAPLSHPKIDEWRDSLHGGIQFHHKGTNFLITGGVDDIWANDEGEFIIVDYKATSKSEPVSIDEDWQISYKRQMALYSWLFKMNGFPVSKTGYFVYCNGLTDRPRFDRRLEFDVTVLPYEIDERWIEPTLAVIHKCLNLEEAPKFSDGCAYCVFVKNSKDL